MTQQQLRESIRRMVSQIRNAKALRSIHQLVQKYFLREK